MDVIKELFEELDYIKSVTKNNDIYTIRVNTSLQSYVLTGTAREVLDMYKEVINHFYTTIRENMQG